MTKMIAYGTTDTHVHDFEGFEKARPTTRWRLVNGDMVRVRDLREYYRVPFGYEPRVDDTARGVSFFCYCGEQGYPVPA